MERLEYEDTYVFRIGCYYSRNKATLFEIDLDDGVFALFGKTKKSNDTKPYVLMELCFEKSKWSYEAASDYWTDMDIRWVDGKKMNKKYPPIEFVIGEKSDLVRGGYIIGMYRNASEIGEKESLQKQIAQMQE